MLIERTGLPGKVEALQSFDTLLLIQMQDCHEGLAGNATQARNVLVRQALTFEVHDFHTLLHVGPCVLICSETDAVPRSVSNRASGVAYDHLNHTNGTPELDRC